MTAVEFILHIPPAPGRVGMAHMAVCGSVFVVFWVDGCVTWKVLGNWKWRPSVEHAWKSLLRNVTFFWLLSQGWAKKKKRKKGGWVDGGEGGGTNWFQENYTIFNGAAAETPQKAYRFKRHPHGGGAPAVCWWDKLRMTSGVHNVCGIASVGPQIVPDQIWDVFLLPKWIVYETSPTQFGFESSSSGQLHLRCHRPTQQQNKSSDSDEHWWTMIF